MPIIVRARNSDNTNDVIRKFKKIAMATDIVQIAKDRRFYQKPSEKNRIIRKDKIRLKKKVRSLKKMKNISPAVIARISERLNG